MVQTAQAITILELSKVPNYINDYSVQRDEHLSQARTMCDGGVEDQIRLVLLIKDGYLQCSQTKRQPKDWTRDQTERLRQYTQLQMIGRGLEKTLETITSDSKKVQCPSLVSHMDY